MNLKKYITLLALSTSFSGYSQWLQQNSGFTPIVGIGSFSLVDTNTLWALAVGTPDFVSATNLYSKTINGGATWTAGQSPNNQIGTISAINANTAWITTCDFPSSSATQIYKTTNGGSNWVTQNVSNLANSSPDFIHFWDASNGVLFCDPSTINPNFNNPFQAFVTNNGGVTWSAVPNTNGQFVATAGEYGYLNCFAVNGNTIWTVTSGGHVLRSTNRGVTWSRYSLPGTITVINPKIAFRDASNGLIALNSYAGSGPGQHYSFLKTTNGGQTWTAVTSTGVPFNNDFCAIPGTGNYVCVGAENNLKGSSISSDDGSTWQLLEDTTNCPRRTAVAFLNSTLGWSGGVNQSSTVGGVFKWSGAVTPMAGVENKSLPAIEISVYPNPTSNLLSVYLNNLNGRKIQLSISNFLGQKVYESTNEYSTPFYTKHIDVSNLPAGCYTLSLFDGISMQARKIIKE